MTGVLDLFKEVKDVLDTHGFRQRFDDLSADKQRNFVDMYTQVKGMYKTEMMTLLLQRSKMSDESIKQINDCGYFGGKKTEEQLEEIKKRWREDLSADALQYLTLEVCEFAVDFPIDSTNASIDDISNAIDRIQGFEAEPTKFLLYLFRMKAAEYICGLEPKKMRPVAAGEITNVWHDLWCANKKIKKMQEKYNSLEIEMWLMKLLVVFLIVLLIVLILKGEPSKKEE